MTLIEELCYRVRSPNAAQRAFRHIAASTPGAWLLSKLAPPLDRALLRWTHQRTSLAGIVAGIPVITLVTTGAKSGLRRDSPLLGIPLGTGIAVIGTSFGQARTPAWWHNLLAHPQVEIRWQGRVVDAVARPADSDESARAWEEGRSLYAGYEAYARRVTERPIHVALLERTE